MKRPQSVVAVLRPFRVSQSDALYKGTTFKSQSFSNVPPACFSAFMQFKADVPGGTNPTARMAHHGLRDIQQHQMARNFGIRGFKLRNLVASTA